MGNQALQKTIRGVAYPVFLLWFGEYIIKPTLVDHKTNTFTLLCVLVVGKGKGEGEGGKSNKTPQSSYSSKCVLDSGDKFSTGNFANTPSNRHV